MLPRHDRLSGGHQIGVTMAIDRDKLIAFVRETHRLAGETDIVGSATGGGRIVS